MSKTSITARKFLMGAAWVASLLLMGSLWIDIHQSSAMIPDLVKKISQVELTVATLQQENRTLKEDDRMLRADLEERQNAVPSEGAVAADEGLVKDPHLAATPQKPTNSIELAHKNWIATEYPKIVEKSQANASSMATVLGNETNISKEKLIPVKNVLSEASIKIANILAAAEDMQDVKAINGKIIEINRWKEDALSDLLSKEEFEQYKSINWMKKLGPSDKK